MGLTNFFKMLYSLHTNYYNISFLVVKPLSLRFAFEHKKKE